MTELTADQIRWTPFVGPDLADLLEPDEEPLVEALLDSQGYRLTLQVAIDALRAAQLERDRARRQLHQLQVEYRRLRADRSAVTA